MAQVAAWMKSAGHRVTGSDEGVYPPMSEFLQNQGITVFSPYGINNLNSADQIVIGNSLSRGNPEVEAVLEKRLPYVSLPELIHTRILRDKLPMVVAGTHGKTTTTAALAHLLLEAGHSAGYMIGGLPIGWETGFAVGCGRWFVLEGDEYDTAFYDKRPKFLHYQPQVVLLNNLEFDHADIYSSLAEIVLQFQRLIQLIPRNGCLVASADQPNLGPLLQKSPCPVITFGLNPQAQVWGKIQELTPAGMKIKMRLHSGAELAGSSPLWGEHQLSNLLGAAAAAEFAGLAPADIAAGIASFRGVQRRLELKYSDEHYWLYDDFAHHPTAISATLTSLRTRHPQKPLIAVLEPRSNTMVRHFFQTEIAEALRLADQVYIGAIHRLTKIPESERLDISLIIKQLQDCGKMAHSNPAIEILARKLMNNLPAEAVIVVMSNGAFSGMVPKLHAELEAGSSRK